MLDSGKGMLYALKIGMVGIQGSIGGHGPPGERWGCGEANSEYGEHPYFDGPLNSPAQMGSIARVGTFWQRNIP